MLHPYDQGFWWLLVEPPLLVVAAGVLFHAFVARPLVHDLEDHR
jgi:ABC-type polysaccharide/polyol phosphate export permease